MLLRGTRVPAPQAALLNASMGHALDFDDTLDTGGSIHPGVSVLAAVHEQGDSVGGCLRRRHLGHHDIRRIVGRSNFRHPVECQPILRGAQLGGPLGFADERRHRDCMHAGTEPDADASLAPRDRSGGRFLREDPARGDLRVGTTRIVDADAKAHPIGDRRRLVGASVRQVRHLDVAGLQGETHRTERKQEVRGGERAGQQKNFPRAPHAGCQRHWSSRSYYKRRHRQSPRRPLRAQR